MSNVRNNQPPKAKILIVDDDESILDAISMILENEGFTVQAAAKGEQTFRYVDDFCPDIILLDVLMSGSDGRIICKQLKGNNQTKYIPVIMISANPTAEKGAKDAGADNFLPKPFDADDLLLMVKEYTH